MGPEYFWDFFLAHADADKAAAEALYELLRPTFKVFLDSRCLLLGDDWDHEIALAQRRSAATLVLVSSRVEGAYYQREEIAAAIDLARHDKNNHRVVPILLDSQAGLPYGLRLKHGLSVPEIGSLEKVAQRLKTDFQMRLAMPESEITKRYESKAPVRYALRVIPQADYLPDGRLGKGERKYVFVGDYEEQRHRTLRQVLSNLWLGDAYERVANSNINWLAIIFEIGELNYSKLDLMPATWKAAFRILSDPRRAGCFRASAEERVELGDPPRDYYSKDQDYWYGCLTTNERRNTEKGADYYIREVLGIDNSCFFGKGITNDRGRSTTSTITSRVFFLKNVPLATISYKTQNLGVPDDEIVLE